MTTAGEFLRVCKFLAVGLLNTLVGLLVIYLCKWLAGFGDVAANVIGYAAGLLNSFAWNRQWTFRDSGAVLPALGRFVAVFLVSYVANLATVMALIHGYGVNSYLAQAAGIAPYTAIFYLGCRLFVFRGT